MNLLVFFILVFALPQIEPRQSLNIAEFVGYLWHFLDRPLQAKQNDNPDRDLSISDYLHKYNYPLETHQVTTDDGYILTLHRIPNGKSTNQGQSKPVVFLAHCFLCTAMEFIYIGPKKSLAMYLADSGFDVWLLNNRGNRYSMKHQRFDTNYNSASFWNFSYHEKGYYDLPASIDYVINTAKVQQITYIGFSQGTTAGLILTSLRPEYNRKINLMVLLAPIAILSNLKSPPFLFMYKYTEKIKELTESLNIYGMPYSTIISWFSKIICNGNSPLQYFCTYMVQLFSGPDYAQFDKNLLTIIGTNLPSGGSLKEIEHYGQAIKTGHFKQYDYGIEANQIYYNNSTPPFYDLSKITVPVAIYYGKNDAVATPKDVYKLIDQLPNLIMASEVSHELFGHLDFIFAKDVKTLVYDSVIKVIKLYN